MIYTFSFPWLETQAILLVLGIIWKRSIPNTIAFGHRLLPKLMMLIRQVRLDHKLDR